MAAWLSRRRLRPFRVSIVLRDSCPEKYSTPAVNHLLVTAVVAVAAAVAVFAVILPAAAVETPASVDATDWSFVDAAMRKRSLRVEANSAATTTNYRC